MDLAVKDTCFLIFDKSGIRRMTKRAPDLAGGEIAVRVTATVDNRHFRSFIDADLELGEQHLVHPSVEFEVEEQEEDASE